MKTLFKSLAVLMIISFLIVLGLCDYAKYRAILKHFPNMTYFEYTMLGESIRIVPKGAQQ